MTKKEKAAVDAEITELKVKLALRWTDHIFYDVPAPPPTSDGLTIGWLPCYDRVEKACSSSTFHGLGTIDKTTSQGPKPLFSTRLLALKALRNDMEARFARELYKVDQWIKEEANNPTPLKKS